VRHTTGLSSLATAVDRWSSVTCCTGMPIAGDEMSTALQEFPVAKYAIMLILAQLNLLFNIIIMQN